MLKEVLFTHNNLDGYGCGGHPKAAGASIDSTIKDEIVTILTDYLNK